MVSPTKAHRPCPDLPPRFHWPRYISPADLATTPCQTLCHRVQFPVSVDGTIANDYADCISKCRELQVKLAASSSH